MSDRDDFAARLAAERIRLDQVEEEKRRVDAARREEAQRRLALIEKEKAARAAREAELAEERSLARERALEKKRREDLENPRAETQPGLVWDSYVDRTCDEFITLMKGKGFAGATTLRHEKAFRGWNIRGYGVGCVIFGRVHRKMMRNAIYSEDLIDRATPLAHNVFLCEDNVLRLFTNWRNSGWDDSTYPSMISDVTGRPMIGRFETHPFEVCTIQIKHEKRQTGNPKMGFSERSWAYEAHVDVQSYKACFHACSIDQVLFPYVL
jgi:hypothetical protein